MSVGCSAARFAVFKKSILMDECGIPKSGVIEAVGRKPMDL